MSVLTKIFVILHVVLSLLLVSGLVVFVNKTENFTKRADEAKLIADRQTAGRLAAEQELVAVRGDRDLRVLEADARSSAYRQALDAKVTEVAGVQAQVIAAQADKTKAEAEAANSRLASEGAMKTVGAQQTVINDQAGKLTESEKRYAESQTMLASLIQERDALAARYRRALEDVAAEKEANDQLRTQVRTVGADGQRAGGAVGAPMVEAAVNLRGVVREKRNINGIEYATITLGSADQVVKGMQFKVVDKNLFLGYLIVDTVEPNQSVGHMSGPNLAMVRPGSEVRTQW